MSSNVSSPVIDKVAPFWTEEDRKKLAALRSEEDKVMEELVELRVSMNLPHPKYTEDRFKRLQSELLNKWQELDSKATKLSFEVETRYINSRSKKAILADVEEIVGSIEKADFKAEIEERLSQIATLKASGADEDSLSELKRLATENYENCYWFVLHPIRVQLNALANDEATTNKAIAIVKKRVALWYVEPSPAYMLMAHGKATDAIAFMSTRNAEIDRITGNASLDKFGVQLVILKLKELQASLGISTDKLLSAAIAAFTRQNDFRHSSREPRREVSLDLKLYAQALGYDVLEHEASTPEEAEREKKRAKAQLDNARTAIKKDLDVIHASVVKWEEPIKGRVKDFDRISIVSRTGIRNGEIRISFSPEIADYLIERNLITQYPVKLLSIDNRNPNAYYIGRKLAEHFFIDNNQIRGTNDRIGIPALLAVTNLPSYEEVQKTDRGHWAERIKEPFERALDSLTEEGVLQDWKYTHAKGIELTEEEAYNITSYSDFIQLYLRFTLTDTVDQSERIEAKQEAREEARKKKRTRKPAKKKE